MRRFAGPLILLLLTVGVFWKMLLTDQYTWLNGSDYAYQVAPWLQFQAAEWHHGHAPLWDPRHAAGQSLIGQMQPGAVYPLNWILFALPLKDGFIRQTYLHWYYAIIHLMAALFAYALARDLGRSVPASILAGAAFAFGGYVGTTGWPQMLNGAVWAPLVLLFSFRAFRGEPDGSNYAFYRNAALAGLFLGIAYLSGHHQVPTFIMLAASALWLARIGLALRDRSLPLAARSPGKLIGGFVILGVIAFCISAPQTLPSYSYAKDAVRWVGLDHPVTWKEKVPYTVLDGFSLSPSSVLGIVIPGVFTNSDPYLGLTIFVLAISGAALAWRESAVRMLAGVAIFGVLLAVAGNTPLHGLLYALVPNVDKARSPSMAMVLFAAAASALAAYGLDFIREESATRWRKRLAVCIGVLAALGWTFAAVLSIVKLPLSVNADRLSMALITATICAAVLWGTRSAPALVILALLEIGNLPTNNWASRTQGHPFVDALKRDNDVAAFLRAQPRPVRADIKEDDVPYNFGDWYGIDTFDGGYFASLPARVLRVMWDERAKSIYGVNYAVGKAPPKPGMRELFTSAAGIKVFETPGAMPRVWSVHEAIGIPDDERIPFAMQEVDPRRRTFVTSAPPALETCANDEVRLASADIRKIVIDANMACRGMVIHGDAWEKNWTAKVDGHAAPLYAAFGIVRGVVVERGAHRIELRYQPFSVYWGLGLCAAAMLSIAALAVLV